ncbi:glutaredoxin domain-containing protein [Sphingomonas sp.]|uniref:glutaredoxin domain-containing protein n=1 Tax=Sphingomonas sp. TaxID=28214 RepID=UPI00286C909A|nr:glutaredoxin domain-containing protein [Sphingomonas sp.]
MTTKAELYRMVLPGHECPHGVRAKQMLEDAGVEHDEHILSSREQVDAFKMKHQVATTPQFFIDAKRIGGSEDVAEYLADQDA